MLLELEIRNFAIIRELRLDFQSRLVVLTGETGAGKSIIMGALDMLLGQRVDMANLRTGSEYASVEAVFSIPDRVRDEVHQILEAEDLLDESGAVVLTRELRRDKRNVARVNGHRSNAEILVQLGELLVDIHGQSDHLSLTRVNQHLGLLDRYAGVDEELAAYQAMYDQLGKVRTEITRLEKLDQEAEEKQELLSYQIDEIKSARLQVGEEQDLRERRIRLANAEKLAELCQEALILLSEAPPDQPTVSDLMGQVVDAVQNLRRTDPSLEKLAEDTEEVFQGVADINQQVREYLEGLEYQPDELETVEERLTVIRDLERKYGETIPEVLNYARSAEKELEEITSRTEKIGELREKEKSLVSDLSVLGQELTQVRKRGAETLTEKLERELSDLKMAGARFRVDFQQRPDPQGLLTEDGRRIKFTRRGMEEVEFLIETNPGEGLKPLAKVASGGETARIMLAVKTVLADADRISTLVFDEIDQGIGGRIGAVVGQKLSRLANQHQVFCITHLPQLACFGDQHFRVVKDVAGQRTDIRVEEISGFDRQQELAQMLGGITEPNLKAAEELLGGVGKTLST